MEEDRNRGFWKGFWIGFALFLACAAVIGGALLWSLLHGLKRWHEEKETERPTREESETKPSGDPSEEADEYDEAAARLKEVMEYVDEYFVLDYDKADMINDALKAYVDGTDDPYSEYLTAEEYAEMMEDSSGSYCGIGVQIQQDPETMDTTIIQVFSNSSALEEGMKVGDLIMAINGEDATKLSLDDIVSRVRGEKGTTVDVTVYRSQEDKEITFTLTRRPVEVDTVYYGMETDRIGYLQLTEFDDVSAGQMQAALKALKKQGCTQLILDVRNNPGGLLSSVLDIADLFMKKDLLIFSMEDKAGTVYEYYSETSREFSGEILVLVNGSSASASEVLTGCLKDHGIAVIMGEKTFGKGIVQGFFRLSDGSAIKLTTEHYQTPGGHDIHKIGIEPDIQGADDPATEDVDELLEQAIAYFQNK